MLPQLIRKMLLSSAPQRVVLGTPTALSARLGLGLGEL